MKIFDIETLERTYTSIFPATKNEMNTEYDTMPGKNSQNIGNVTKSEVTGSNVCGNGISIVHNDMGKINEMIAGYQSIIERSQKQIDSLIEIINKSIN